ncbi:hypothetical protein F0562_014962 [Nyssa sinensis]|uniref:LOB domain-containing protein n=1 Tax=Nyssa sinensis TaxID=561372 RepID=A0A5J4ZSK9_9ASTE|nr:hypothetical protein F0562_014962 [Nyssa sinensis]
MYAINQLFFSLMMVEESKREDAVKAVVYEATARLRNPVCGSAGDTFHLQKIVQELQGRLESVAAQVLELQQQRNQISWRF